jgi:voltage-gated potassium channel
LSRLARIIRLLRGKQRAVMIKDVLDHRGQYAAFITVLAAAVVLVVASIVELAFETAPGADGNITTGGDALWWAIVTMTTVGYGDHFPVTAGGRITATFVMFMGVGIIGALASILASFLVAPSSSEETEEPAGQAEETPVGAALAEGTSAVAAGPALTTAVEEELRAIRAELEALRLSMDAKGNS